MQEYDFTIHYKKGEENTVADAFSRLCDVSDREQFLTVIEEYISEENNSVLKYAKDKEELNALDVNHKKVPREVFIE